MTVPEAPHIPDHDVLITGDYYMSAGGPSVILVLTSVHAATWLDGILQRIHEFSSPWSLSSDPHVRVSNVSDISIGYKTNGRDVELRKVTSSGSPRFLLLLTTQGCSYIRGLVAPFVQGTTGHQYLTQGGVDDALVELSLGEQHGGS